MPLRGNTHVLDGVGAAADHEEYMHRKISRQFIRKRNSSYACMNEKTGPHFVRAGLY